MLLSERRCNSGVSLTPVIDGETYTFATRGLYNGMSLMGDHQTGSYWDHGHGRMPATGRSRGGVWNWRRLRHMQADQALAQYPDARIARSRLPLPFGLAAGLMKILVRLTKGRFLPPGFAGSMGGEDPRRPRLEMGLGRLDGQGQPFLSARYSQGAGRHVVRCH